MIEEPAKPSRLRRLFSLRTAMIIVVGLVLIFPYVIVGVLSSDNHKLIDQNRDLIQQLIDAGEKPVVTDPTDETQGLGTIIGPTGIPGRDGADGKDGENATDAQVRFAVIAYCNLNMQCAGPAGRDGQDSTVAGPTGSTGATGAPGQNATPEQIASAVEAYCAARNGCQGPAGPAGADSTVPGPTGATGPAPESFTWNFLGIQYVCTNDGSGNYNCA